jgi:hypothetical protein
MREKTVMGEGRATLDGSLKRVRGGRRKEKGNTRRTWKRGSMESKSDPWVCVAAAADDDAAAALPPAWSDLGGIVRRESSRKGRKDGFGWGC